MAPGLLMLVVLGYIYGSAAAYDNLTQVDVSLPELQRSCAVA